MIWRQRKHAYPMHYEEFVGRLRGYTLCVRGPRGGSVWRWTVEAVEKNTRAHLTVEHGTSVERDLAQHAAEYAAEHLS